MPLVLTIAALASGSALAWLGIRRFRERASLPDVIEAASGRGVILLDARGELSDLGSRARRLLGVEGRCDPYGLDDLPMPGLRARVHARDSHDLDDARLAEPLRAWIDGQFIDIDYEIVPLRPRRGMLPAIVAFDRKGAAATTTTRQTRSRRKSAAGRGRASAGALEGRRLLLAEDGPDNQLLMSYVLLGLGADLVLVEDGQQAVDLATTEHFDIVMLDLQMPIIDGYEAARRIRAAKPDLVILAVSANEDAGPDCILAGFDAQLAKPLRRTHLLDTYSAITLERKSRSSSVVRALSDSVASGGNSVATGDDPSAGSEWEQLFADPEFRTMVEEFRDDLDERIQAMRAAVEIEDWSRLESLAHQLKGAAGGFGFFELSDVSGRLEAELRGGNDPRSVASRLLDDVAIAAHRSTIAHR
ncbi:MAG: response regulator [Planctomycetes bacterium]|nr:response regulator [Planctomycetota bacterium]MCB9919549.1 response regulator [Planctomycetota bacterium]